MWGRVQTSEDGLPILLIGLAHGFPGSTDGVGCCDNRIIGRECRR